MTASEEGQKEGFEMTGKVLTPAGVGEKSNRANLATRGPWRQGIPGNFSIYAPDGHGVDSGAVARIDPIGSLALQRARNRAFIAASRLDVPALCESHEALRAELAKALSSLMEQEGQVESLETDLRNTEANMRIAQSRAELADDTIARLRGLIDDLPHAGTCPAGWKIKLLPGLRCNCVKSQVNL